MTTAILLEDRGVIEVTGEDAAKFLHNLVTNDVASLKTGEARFAALLTPQGKILFDFVVFALGEGRFLLDCPLSLASDLEKRLNLYKLRSRITVTNLSGALETIVFPDAASRPEVEAVALAPDPRAETLGWRALAAKGRIAASGPLEAYEARRIRAGVPLGGVDFAYSDAFPHEADMDLFSGVDFKKGCYVGQEVVSRMKHRNLVRKRVTPYRATGGAPAPGQSIRAGEIEIGVTGSAVGEEGLALIRLDRLADAKEKGDAPTAGGVALEFIERN
ncbi:YgfZ/GcvT domain-containing protein [Methylocystis parvus]|uniref:Folate-binding protein YgfZ n=1 Tax=Methylocystis parvus TaxID=134 RepID=A0A6B8M552_9HYPH|nr:folate-binding protein YgfZ [Methylocystis parvus]QGM96899.1 folate-binding protein YgfZ [Methylocystis parvus]WBJ99217.1 folate-binding protein YgfZ [Methylocystis parvus OBBP]